MRSTSHSWAILVGTALIGLAATAQAQTAPSAGIAQVEVRGKAEYKLAPHEFDTYVGSYRFDSGDTLKVWQQGTRYYSQLKNQARHELMPTAAGNFVATSGAKIAFSEDGNTVAVSQFDKLMVAMR
jgi:hypothetical protein